MNSLPPNPGAQRGVSLPAGIQRLSIVAELPLVPDLATHCYLLPTSTGTLVVDPPSNSEAALAAILSAAQSAISGVVVTHTHPDHIGGVGALVQRSGVPLYAHPAARPHLPSEIKLRPLAEGATLAQWLIWHTPGHRADSLSLIDPAARIGVVGDMVAGSGTVIINPPDGNLRDYLHSLERLRAAGLSWLLPGHGPVVVDPSTLLTYYIEHRLNRERKVLAALSGESRPVSYLLPLVYNDTDPSLYALARRSLRAHLLKLQEEGLAVSDERGWRRS